MEFTSNDAKILYKNVNFHQPLSIRDGRVRDVVIQQETYETVYLLGIIGTTSLLILAIMFSAK